MPLYPPRNSEQVRARALAAGAAEPSASGGEDGGPAEPARRVAAAVSGRNYTMSGPPSDALRDEVAQLRLRLEQLERLLQ